MMEVDYNMKKYFSKKEIILVLLLLVLPIVVHTFTIPVSAGDELFNFQSTSKIVNGYKIYSDFNVIITPLFFYIGALIQKIFGNYLIVFRIYSIAILFLFYVGFYLILRKLNVRKQVAIVGVLLLISVSEVLVVNGANYNVLAVALYLVGALLALNKLSNKNSFILGIMSYLIFMTKQNVGAFFILALIISQLFCYKKEAIKHIIIQILVFAILIILSILVLFVQGSFEQFIDYTFLGIFNFSQNNTSATILKNPKMLVIYVLAAIVTVIFFIKTIKEKKEENYKLFIFALMLSFVVIPIINLYHIILSLTLIFAQLMILLDKVFDKGCSDEEYEKKIKELHLMSIDKMLLIMDIILYSIILLIVIKGFLSFDKPVIEKNTDSPYLLCAIEENVQNNINEVIDFIKSHGKVILISDDACIYTPILKSNNGILDLPFNGNLGKEGISKLKREIDNLTDTKILFEEERFWQIPEEIVDYLDCNFNQEGILDAYIIYSK